MIAAVAWCPYTALLVSEVAGTAFSDVEVVRDACDQAVRSMLATGLDAVTVLGPAESSQPLTSYVPGLQLPSFAELPLPYAIGTYLLDRAGCSLPRRYVPVDDSGTPTPLSAGAISDSALPDDALSGDALSDDTGTRIGLLVMGDGSARLGEKAPGYLDARAAPFDAVVAAALAVADTATLAALDVQLGVELLVGGIGPWKLLGGKLLGSIGNQRSRQKQWQAELLYSGAPFGVNYLVAAWTSPGAGT